MRPLLAGLLLCAATAFPATREPVHARRAMVASSEAHATQVGVDVLHSGGNAIDAAVAVGFALAVTHPYAGNLGGGGFMLIRFAGGRSTFVDFREKAPAAATRDMYVGPDGKTTGESISGYKASGVPGTVRGLSLAHGKYGTKNWRKLVEPAQKLAERGFPLGWGAARAMKDSKRMAEVPESRRIFQNGGRFFEYEAIFRQRDLAATLKRIARKGPDDFYTGRTARLIADDMSRNGGLITMADLAAYDAKEREPVRGTYRGYEVVSAPPPSSGGAGVVQMLQMLDGSNYFEAGFDSAAAIHYVAECMRRFFADRAEYFGDMDFADVPLQELISPDYARRRAATIDPEHATPSTEVKPGLALAPEPTQTTHYSVVDAQGNAVSVTYTLNGGFGSGVTVKGAGFLLNNEMDDFTAKPGEPNMFGLLQSARNAIEPGKRPLSAMTPTILSREGKLELVTGSPGGPTIISTVLQTILNVIDFEMDVQQAIDAPRFHHQWMPDELRMDDEGFSPDTIRLLEDRGHTIRRVPPMGRAMAIRVTEDGLTGAADARSEGLAAGF